MVLEANVFAIIVLYNPDIPDLIKLLNSARHQVRHIVITDNSTHGTIKDKIAHVLNDFSDVSTYIDLTDNLGIAIAQNKAIELAITKDATHLLLLDQDSYLPNNIVAGLSAAYRSLEAQGHNIACVAPTFIDKKIGTTSPIFYYKGLIRKQIIPTGEEEYIIADHVISSGSLIAVKDWLKIGGLQENLFIDYVDTEWCLRARKLGYLTFVIPKLALIHDIGDGYAKVGTRNVVLHSDFRNYYMIRNSIYLILYSRLQYGFRLLELLKIPFYLFLYTFYSTKRAKTFKIMILAIKDGIFKNMGKGHFK